MKIVIRGVELDELKDLDTNLEILREELNHKIGFWNAYEQGIRSVEKGQGSEVGSFFRVLYFIGLIPWYLTYIIGNKKHENIIQLAEEELIRYYEKPENKVRQFRLQCQLEKEWYQKEIKDIEEELKQHYQSLNLPSLGEEMRKDLQALIDAYEQKKSKKVHKFEFYKGCEDRLAGIEQQMQVKKSIQRSKQKLQMMEEGQEGQMRQKEMKKEFELFDYYGNLLSDISDNLKKVEQDKEEKMEELELKELLAQIQTDSR